MDFEPNGISSAHKEGEEGHRFNPVMSELCFPVKKDHFETVLPHMGDATATDTFKIRTSGTSYMFKNL